MGIEIHEMENRKGYYHVGANPGQAWLLANLTMEQARRAVDFLSDSPINWNELAESFEKDEVNIRIILARATVTLAKEFQIPLGELLDPANPNNTEKIVALVELYALLRPRF